LQQNPVFNAFRGALPASGFVVGSPVGTGYATKWAFDLPDSSFLFPGDVLHYYIRAGDDLAGDVVYSTLPPDLTGFGDFGHPLAYNSSFVVHALPSIADDGIGGYKVPGILFWNDFGDRGGEDEWYGAFDNLGLVAGLDYDIYYTNSPRSGVGNGVGGRTNGPALAAYELLIYTSGNLSSSTISNGDFSDDAGDDIGALLNWMNSGNKGLFLTGDGLASDLGINAGANGLSFLENVMGLNVETNDIRPIIGNQSFPLVLAVPANGVIQNVDSWIAYSSCLGVNQYLYGLNQFDGVTTIAGASRLAEFADPNDNPGGYDFSAATLNIYNGSNRIVSMPYDFMNIATDPDEPATGLSARVRILEDVLSYFGFSGGGTPANIPEATAFSVSSYPNPFNPATRMDYTIRSPGHLSLKIYDVRGRLVRTLLDEQVETGGFVMWDGSNESGAQVASGVYFREARMAGEVDIEKLALIK